MNHQSTMKQTFNKLKHNELFTFIYIRHQKFLCNIKLKTIEIKSKVRHPISWGSMLKHCTTNQSNLSQVEVNSCDHNILLVMKVVNTKKYQKMTQFKLNSHSQFRLSFTKQIFGPLVGANLNFFARKITKHKIYELRNRLLSLGPL